MVPNKGYNQTTNTSDKKTNDQEVINTVEVENKVTDKVDETVVLETIAPQEASVPVTIVADEVTTIVQSAAPSISNAVRSEAIVYAQIDAPAFTGTVSSDTKVATRTTAAALLVARLPKNRAEHNLALACNVNTILKELCVLQKSNNVALDDITSTCGEAMFEYIVNSSSNEQVKVLINILKKEVK